VGYSDAKGCDRDGRDFGWEIAHAAVSRRPPFFLGTTVARTAGYTYAATVWDFSRVQGPFPVALPNPNANDTIRNFLIAAWGSNRLA
jgi:hypothetical protein